MQLDLLVSLVFIRAPLASSVLHHAFLFFFEILVFHFMAVIIQGMLIFYNLQIYFLICRFSAV